MLLMVLQSNNYLKKYLYSDPEPRDKSSFFGFYSDHVYFRHVLKTKTYRSLNFLKKIGNYNKILIIADKVEDSKIFFKNNTQYLVSKSKSDWTDELENWINRNEGAAAAAATHLWNQNIEL